MTESASRGARRSPLVLDIIKRLGENLCETREYAAAVGVIHDFAEHIDGSATDEPCSCRHREDRADPQQVESAAIEWGHRYPDGSVIADSSEIVAKSRASISAVSSARDGQEPLILVRRLVTPWEEADRG